nr:secretion protein HlyD [Selenomonas felix]
MFCPIEAANRTHSEGYVEDLLTKSGRKRYVKMVVPNLSALPLCQCNPIPI